MPSLIRPWWRQPYFALQFACVTAGAAALFAILATRATVLGVMTEEGPIEWLTARLYFFAAGSVWLMRSESVPVRVRVMLTIVLLAFAGREMDLHKAFTGISVLRLSFYFGEVPIGQRIGSAAVLAPVAVSLLGIARWTGPLVARLRRQEAAAVTVATFVGALVLAKIADRTVNVLAEDFSIRIAPRLQGVFLAVEEVLELCLPCLACLACAQASEDATPVAPRPPLTAGG